MWGTLVLLGSVVFLIWAYGRKAGKLGEERSVRKGMGDTLDDIQKAKRARDSLNDSAVRSRVRKKYTRK